MILRDTTLHRHAAEHPAKLPIARPHATFATDSTRMLDELSLSHAATVSRSPAKGIAPAISMRCEYA
jgi:hypothetical protein